MSRVKIIGFVFLILSFHFISPSEAGLFNKLFKGNKSQHTAREASSSAEASAAEQSSEEDPYASRDRRGLPYNIYENVETANEEINRASRGYSAFNFDEGRSKIRSILKRIEIDLPSYVRCPKLDDATTVEDLISATDGCLTSNQDEELTTISIDARNLLLSLLAEFINDFNNDLKNTGNGDCNPPLLYLHTKIKQSIQEDNSIEASGGHSGFDNLDFGSRPFGDFGTFDSLAVGSYVPPYAAEDNASYSQDYGGNYSGNYGGNYGGGYGY